MKELVVKIGGRLYSRDCVNAMSRWHEVTVGVRGESSASQWMDNCMLRLLDMPAFLETTRNVSPKMIATLLKPKPLRHTSRELSLFGGKNWLTSECMNRTMEMIAVQSGNAVYVSANYTALLVRNSDLVANSPAFERLQPTLTSVK